MGEPTVRRANEGFFTRLGRAIDTFNGDDGKSSGAAAGKSADVASAKPLPKKYAASSGRVVRGTFGGGYVAKAFKLAADMRALAAKEDHWYNRTKVSDVDEVVNKYKPMIAGTAIASYKQTRAKEMLRALFDTPTGDNLFWEFESTPLYRCTLGGGSTSEEVDCGVDKDGFKKSYTRNCRTIVESCSVAGHVRERVVQEFGCERDSCF